MPFGQLVGQSVSKSVIISLEYSYRNTRFVDAYIIFFCITLSSLAARTHGPEIGSDGTGCIVGGLSKGRSVQR